MASIFSIANISDIIGLVNTMEEVVATNAQKLSDLIDILVNGLNLAAV